MSPPQDLSNVSLSSLSSSAYADITSPSERDSDSDDEDLLTFYDVKGVFDNMTGLMDGPFPVPDLDQFVDIGTAVENDLGAGALSEIVETMESAWTFGNIITRGTLHFAPAGEPAVG